MSGWQIDTRNILRVPDFATAERLWNEAKPWRNELSSWRQLAERRATHKRIVRIDDGAGYQLVLYSTPIVTYYKDGRVDLRTYDTNSTQQLAWLVRPEGTGVHSVSGRMYWGFNSPDGPKYVREGRGPLCLDPAGPGQYRLSTAPAEDFEWRLDRKKAAETRKKFSHYKRWYDVTMRLHGQQVRLTDARSAVQEILLDPENPERYQLNFGPPQHLYSTAYERTGARYRVPAPIDRLPRKQK